MMEGITILSQSEVYALTNLAGCHIFIGLAVTIGMILFGLVSYNENWRKTFIFSFLCALVGIAGHIAGVLMPQEFSYIQHKVLIDEEINLIDFIEQYEIIDQEGLIFTIKEREGERSE